jgi:hypothetical protein
MVRDTYHEEPLRCGRCGEIIGVYEPLVLLEGRAARSTSCAAEPELMRATGDFFHRACHVAAHAEHDGQSDA